MLALINDVLDLAKIEAGAFTLHERDVNVESLMAECRRLMLDRAAARDLALESEIAGPLPHILADERALKQVLLNLLSNAIKFTPPQGRITLFASCDAGDESLVFGVADTGVGIAPGEQDRVFENFGQGRHDVVTNDKGTGLGLPIVKGLVEAHGGSVALKSEPGFGTVVTVRLPAMRVRASAELRAAS